MLGYFYFSLYIEGEGKRDEHVISQIIVVISDFYISSFLLDRLLTHEKFNDSSSDSESTASSESDNEKDTTVRKYVFSTMYS